VLLLLLLLLLKQEMLPHTKTTFYKVWCLPEHKKKPNV
jgi:hypothetical protein